MLKVITKNIDMVFYRNQERLKVLDDICLEVKEKEFVTIVGPSGCGKTTLLRIMNGLLKPTGGKVFIDEEEVTGPSSKQATVFQQPCLLPWKNILNNVYYGLECRNLVNGVNKKRVSELIELVGLAGFEKFFPHEVSGGMQQRTNLARALSVDPEVLFMDEPFASLDAQTRESMQGELLRIWQRTEKTVIFITHQIDEAIYLSDRVVILTKHPGRIKNIINIPFSRPRDISIKRTYEFLDIEREVWSNIESLSKVESESKE